RALRSPPSCPTRRSSDLRFGRPERSRSWNWACTLEHFVDIHDLLARTDPDGHAYPRPMLAREHWESLNGVWDFAIDRDATWTTPDRKSTRLNSSHVKISY